MKRLIDRLPSFVKNRYLLTAFAFMLWMAFFDRNNVRFIVKEHKRFDKLSSQIEYYEEENPRCIKEVDLLENDPEYREKFARERYFMKKDDEVLIIVEESSEK